MPTPFPKFESCPTSSLEVPGHERTPSAHETSKREAVFFVTILRYSRIDGVCLLEAKLVSLAWPSHTETHAVANFSTISRTVLFPMLELLPDKHKISNAFENKTSPANNARGTPYCL